MGVLMAWAIAAGVQTVRDVRYLGRAPVPSEYVASGMLFGALSILSSVAENLATALAWGFLFAMTVEAGGPHALVAEGFPKPAGKYFSPGSPGVAAQSGAGVAFQPFSAANPMGTGTLPAPTSTRGGNRVGSQVVAAASSMVGLAYGGCSHTSADCSCLAQRAYAAAGIALPRTAALQIVACVPITRSSLSPGDLGFMPLGETFIRHVAIFDGSGWIESAPSHGGVGRVPFNYQPGPYYYGRPLQAFTKARRGSH